MHSALAALRVGNSLWLRKQIANQCRCMTVYETSRKGSQDYESREEYDAWLKKPMSEKIAIRSQYLKKNLLLWYEEWKEKVQMDPKEVLPGDRDIQFKFNSPEECEKWIISADSDWNEGFSTGKLETSTTGYGVFHGKLDTALPKTGSIARAGWITMSFKCPKRSFGRPNTFDWDRYTHLIMRVRGDGRKYSLMIKTPGYFDIHWLDLKAYSLFTHGGPYWQEVRIPFSKFINSHKGRVQDDQRPFHMMDANEFGISLMDNNRGPFRLEIEYIGVEYDPAILEQSAYEMYRIDEFRYKV